MDKARKNASKGYAEKYPGKNYTEQDLQNFSPRLKQYIRMDTSTKALEKGLKHGIFPEKPYESDLITNIKQASYNHNKSSVIVSDIFKDIL